MSGRTPATVRRPELAGIALTVFATCMFGLMDALSKMLVLALPVPLVVWLRHLLAVPVVFLLFRGMLGRWPSLRSGRPGLQLLRATLLVIQIGIAFVAFRTLPIGEVQTIFATTPLLVLAVSARLLGEPAGLWRVVAVVVGFAGLLVMLRPGLAVLQPGALVASVGILVYAAYQLTTRMAGRIDPPETSFAIQALLSAALTTLVGPWFWQPPEPWAWLLLLAVALIGSLGHYALVRALALAPAPVVQPFLYFHIVFASLFGFVFFGEVPDRWALLGGLLIVGAGLLASWREARR